MGIWESSKPLLARSFEVADMESAMGLAEGIGTEWNKYIVFAEHDNLDLVRRTVHPQDAAVVHPTVAGLVSVTSDDVADDAGGSGALMVRLQGVGADYVGSADPSVPWLYDFVPLTGTTPSTSNVPFFRVFNVQVVTAGASRNNVGTLSATIGGQIQVVVPPTLGLSKTSHFSIPKGYTGYAKLLTVTWDGTEAVLVTAVLSIGGVDLSAFRARWERSRGYDAGVFTIPDSSDLWVEAQRVAGGGGTSNPIGIGVSVLLHRS